MSVIPLLAVLAGSALCAPFFEPVDPVTYEEISFLRQYGYLPAAAPGVQLAYTAASLARPVRLMQAYAGLPPTGRLDKETRKFFKAKRCGVKDVYPPVRQKRFSSFKGWRHRNLTYCVESGARTLPRSRAEALVAAALAVWAPYGRLSFARRDTGPVDIDISFQTGEHGDTFPFDGAGGTLAHAFPPPVGSLHFDDDEVWRDDPAIDTQPLHAAIDSPPLHIDTGIEQDDGDDFLSVAIHEIGHSLGLEHSTSNTSVMFAYYSAARELSAEDVMRMYELYYEDDHELSLRSPTPSSGDGESPGGDGGSPGGDGGSPGGDGGSPSDGRPDLCAATYDTVQVIQGKIYVFKDEWVWVLRARRAAARARRLRAVFRGLPRRVRFVTAVYERRNGTVVIFHGKTFYEFSPALRKVRAGSIHEYGLPRSVKRVSTAFRSAFNNKTYLIQDDRFWRYDEAAGGADGGYPKSMTAWRDLPYPVDAALSWENETFFFQGPWFWRFDDARVAAHDSYPQPAAPVWFPCPLTAALLRPDY